MVLTKNYDSLFLDYGDALVKAVVIAKFILIGEATPLAKKRVDLPLLSFAVLKAFLYTLLVFLVRVVEQLVIYAIHGKDLAGGFDDVRLDDVLARSVVIFCTFIPFFAFRELGRALGDDKFKALLLGKRGASVE